MKLGLAVAVLALSIAAPVAAEQAVPIPFEATGCATTLLGEPARALILPEAAQRRLDQDLEIARAAVRIAPDREDSYIWLGRRLGYLGRQCEAVDAFSEGLARFPDSHRLLRFRGQALTRVRAFNQAMADYSRAAVLAAAAPDSYEPDGFPNARNLMLGTYRTNIHYYRAQTRFAVGDYAGLITDMEASLAHMPAHIRTEHEIPTTFWRYLALRKLGRTAEAAALVARAPVDAEIVEAHQYRRAVQLFGGTLTPAELADDPDPLVRFALAMQARFAGDDAEANRRLEAVTRDTPGGYWPAEIERVAPAR